MESIHVPAGGGPRAYPVHIGESLIRQLPGILAANGFRRDLVVVSSPLVWKLHGSRVVEVLNAVKTVLVPDGERFKSLATVSRIYEGLLKAEADRSAGLVALGGGVIGDMAGFAAATYLRGIALAHVPTTLLAQVDSAIGGKVGVNHPLGKNLIGAFYPPSAVIIDPLLLRTLPRREFRAGLYEVVKYGVIASRPLFERVASRMSSIFARDPAALEPVILESCQIKARVVGADEREQGPRRILNFGHTAGHALEAVTKYRRFRHGEAIAYGMLIAAEIAVARGVFSPSGRDALSSVIVQMGPLPPIGDLSVTEMLEAMRRDKKVIGGVLHFVLPVEIGATTIATDVTEKELEGALSRAGMKRG